MFCNKCGAELQEGMKFCTSCGAKVESKKVEEQVIEVKNNEVTPEVKVEVKPEMQVEAKPKMQTSENQDERVNKKSKVFGGLWKVLLIIMAITTLIYYNFFERQSSGEGWIVMAFVIPSLINTVFIVVMMIKLDKYL